VPPPLDRDGVDLEEAPRSDGGRGAGDHPARPADVERQRSPEEVGDDEHQVVAKPVRDRLRPGVAAERALRDHGVEQDDRRVCEREPVDEVRSEGQAACSYRRDRDRRDRRREHDLLPGLDRVERVAVHAAPVEERHDDVVQGEAEDEDQERDQRPVEDDHDAGGEQDAVDDECGGGHRRVSRRKRSRLKR
jgi:hypothetical protein